MSKVDVKRDLFDIEFDFYDYAAADRVDFFVQLKEWTETSIVIAVNFTEPLLVSNGNKMDKIFVKIMNSEIIRAKASGLPVSSLFTEMVSLVPKQLPLGIELERLVSAVSQTTHSVLAIMIVQICLQILLRGSLK